MRKLTPTLTQSGLLAVLLQRQGYKISQLARRRAQRKHMRAALWSTLTWPWRALTAPVPVLHSRRALRRIPPVPISKSFTEADCHVSSNPHVHRTPATDSRRSADPTSRMGQTKWRIPHVRFLRDVSDENARHFDAKGIQQTDRSSLSRTGTGSNWKLKRYGICFKASWSHSYSCLGIAYLRARAFVAARSK